ncbi:hypothetical protein PLESTF_001101700 [Pleodorina starrii]|nr:hypothetical protein PLESTF_001101700 [Pleodorina starrii]
MEVGQGDAEPIVHGDTPSPEARAGRPSQAAGAAGVGLEAGLGDLYTAMFGDTPSPEAHGLARPPLTDTSALLNVGQKKGLIAKGQSGECGQGWMDAGAAARRPVSIKSEPCVTAAPFGSRVAAAAKAAALRDVAAWRADEAAKAAALCAIKQEPGRSDLEPIEVDDMPFPEARAGRPPYAASWRAGGAAAAAAGGAGPRRAGGIKLEPGLGDLEAIEIEESPSPEALVGRPPLAASWRTGAAAAVAGGFGPRGGVSVKPEPGLSREHQSRLRTARLIAIYPTTVHDCE